MAEKKPAAPAAKPAVKKSTAVATWDERLAAKAAIAKKSEESVSTGNFVSMKGGVLMYAGNPVTGNKLDVVVVDFIMENAYYEGKYDPSTPQSPLCFAFGRDEEEMVPHEKSASKQSNTCSTCEHNEWDSGDSGRGKACKNARRLALITSDALDNGAADIAEAAVAYMKVPVTSVKSWAGYVNQLAAANRPPLAFVTEVSVTPDAKTQFKVNFKAKEQITDGAMLEALLGKSDVVETLISFPYQATEPVEKKASAKKVPAKNRKY